MVKIHLIKINSYYFASNYEKKEKKMLYYIYITKEIITTCMEFLFISSFILYQETIIYQEKSMRFSSFEANKHIHIIIKCV